MDSRQLYRYERGKQLVCLSAIIAAMLGYVLDAITYYSKYSVFQFWLQGLSAALCLVALVIFLIDRNRNYVLTFGLISYGVIINIWFTVTIIHTFHSFENFTEANILSRDVLFILLYIALSAFIVGRKHIIIQGVLLVALVLYIVLIKQDVFFRENAAIYLVAILGFLIVLYLFMGTLNSLIEGLKVSNQQTKALQQAEVKKNKTLLNYQSVILSLINDESFYKNNIEELFKKICTTGARNLAVSRVSVWILEDNHSRLVRKHLHEGGADSIETTSLIREHFPTYFEALEHHPIILADQAQEHADTREFTEAYLKPLNIVSMLDCPIVMDGKPIGVICCENQYEPRPWTTEDALFIQSLSGHISICFKNLEIKNLLDKVSQQNLQLVESGNEIETMNEELSAVNEELSSLNENLEVTVKNRTSELELQNKQLTEYAFINSHLLRAPLARILGLCDLIIAENVPPKAEVLLKALKQSSEELDSIIKKISDILYDGNNLSREDVKAIVNRTLNIK